MKLNTSMMNLQALMGNKVDLQKSLARMASGQRLNSASDGAAELSQAIEMQSEQLSNMAAQRNANNGLSMVHTAEGAAGQTGEMLSRMRELSVQAASETLNDDQRAMIQTEMTSLQTEMDRVAGTTEFNGVKIADGSRSQISVQIGTGDDPKSDAMQVKLADLRADSLGVGTSAVNVSTSSGALSALDSIDTAMDTLNGYRSDYGAAHNRLNTSANLLETNYQSTAAAESRIMDTDYAYESAEAAKSQMLMDMGLAVAGQANRINQGMARSLLSN